jgi:hypothetical protein
MCWLCKKDITSEKYKHFERNRDDFMAYSSVWSMTIMSGCTVWPTPAKTCCQKIKSAIMHIFFFILFVYPLNLKNYVVLWCKTFKNVGPENEGINNLIT